MPGKMAGQCLYSSDHVTLFSHTAASRCFSLSNERSDGFAPNAFLAFRFPLNYKPGDRWRQALMQAIQAMQALPRLCGEKRKLPLPLKSCRLCTPFHASSYPCTVFHLFCFFLRCVLSLFHFAPILLVARKVTNICVFAISFIVLSLYCLYW